MELISNKHKQKNAFDSELLLHYSYLFELSYRKTLCLGFFLPDTFNLKLYKFENQTYLTDTTANPMKCLAANALESNEIPCNAHI